MWMHPGAGYKEQHHYKVDKDAFAYRDDFNFNKGSNPSMHTKNPDHRDSEFKHNYTVEKDEFAYRDDFHFNKGSSPSMHMTKPDHCDSEFKHNYKHSDHQYTTPDHHHNNHGKLGPNMHVVMKEYYGPNKHGMTYSETIYEQEEKLLHGNKYDNSNFAGYHNYGKLSYGGREGGGYADHQNYGMLNYGGNERYYSDEWKKAPAVWDCKGIDD